MCSGPSLDEAYRPPSAPARSRRHALSGCRVSAPDQTSSHQSELAAAGQPPAQGWGLKYERQRRAGRGGCLPPRREEVVGSCVVPELRDRRPRACRSCPSRPARGCSIARHSRLREVAGDCVRCWATWSPRRVSEYSEGDSPSEVGHPIRVVSGRDLALVQRVENGRPTRVMRINGRYATERKAGIMCPAPQRPGPVVALEHGRRRRPERWLVVHLVDRSRDVHDDSGICRASVSGRPTRTGTRARDREQIARGRHKAHPAGLPGGDRNHRAFVSTDADGQADVRPWTGDAVDLEHLIEMCRRARHAPGYGHHHAAAGGALGLRRRIHRAASSPDRDACAGRGHA